MKDQENTVIGQKRLAEADPFEDNDINGHGQNDSQELDSSRRANTKRKVDKNDGEGIALANTQKSAEDKNISDYTDCKPDSGERPLQELINTDVSREETFHKGKSEGCSIDADATREDKEANPIRILFKETEKGEVPKPNDDSHSKEEIQEEKEELQKNEEERKDVEVAGQESKEDLKKENEDSNEQKYKKLFERKSPPSVQTFQQLSGAQNAFSGVSGTGFTISSFTFDTKVSSPGFGLTPKFGSFNAGSTSMASPSFTSSLGLRETMFAAKQANQNSPLSTTNSVSPFQLFGSPDAKQVSFSPSEKGAVCEVTIPTGEENERTQFTAEASLFQYINSTWKERGKGELRINIPTEDTGNARLVMRAKGNYRLILNASLYPEMKLTVMDIKSFTFVCLNIAAEAKEGLGTFALKFKDGSIAEEFKVILEAEKKRRPTITKHVEGLDTKVDS